MPPMKNLFLSMLLLFVGHTILAQNSSKVFFYRHDPFYVIRPISGHYLFLNGKKQKRIFKNSIFILNDAPAKCICYMRPNKKCKIEISPGPKTITFIEIKTRIGWWKPTFSFTNMTFDEVKQRYDTQPWFRKRLRKIGYTSVNDLNQ